MKTVFNNRELAHVWAGQKQPTGRGSNMFFDGPSIFSYGRHFEIARWALPGVVLFNSARYSSSTAKHQNYVSRAINHAAVFYVPSMTDHAANVRHYLAKIEEARRRALRAVKWADMHRADVSRMAGELAQYVDKFKKHIPAKLREEARRVARLVKAGKIFSAGELAKLAAAEVRRVASEKKAAARREEQRIADEAQREYNKREAPRLLELWAAGDNVEILNAWDDELPTRLRLKDGRVETSRGAQITERRARELWAALVRGANVAGETLDNYTVTSWDGAVLKVGCHDIMRAELENMAAVLGLPGALPVPVVAEVA